MHGDFDSFIGVDVDNEELHKQLWENAMTAWHDNVIEERIKKRETENVIKLGIRMRSLGAFQRLKERVSKIQEARCLHNSCDICKGKGKKPDGTDCVHMLSCPCPICSPSRMICDKSEAMNFEVGTSESDVKYFYGVRNEKGIV